MPKPRYQRVSIDDTPYYHVISRCVRRAFLCGKDELTGKCFEHRRDWIQDRLALLESVFAIDIAAYAIMSNHFHLVLCVAPEQATLWSEADVCQRWGRLFSLPPLVTRWQDREPLNAQERDQVTELLTEWRRRLSDLSWFMRCLNEPIARWANAEDDCTGRFWEGRFHSQALLDETALLTCMAYVDLNPVRAGISTNPGRSPFTSIEDRLRKQPKVAVMPMLPESSPEQPSPSSLPPPRKPIPCALEDYLELVEWTGRAVHPGKRGFIPEGAPRLLDQLHLSDKAWLKTQQTFRQQFHRVIGPMDKIRSLCQRIGRKWLWGHTANRLLYRLAS